MDSKGLSSRVVTWFVVCSVVAALYLGRQFLVPIALAAFLAFVLAPLVRKLTRSGMKRVVATLVTMLGVAVIVAGIVWMLTVQVRGFSENLPEYRAHLREKSADVRAMLGSRVQEATATIRDLGNELSSSATSATPTTRLTSAPVVAAADDSMGLVQSTLGSVLQISVMTGLVVLLAAVMLFRLDDLHDRMLALAGESDLVISTQAGKEAATKVGLFLRRQLIVNAIHGTSVGIVLWFVDVPTPVVWGFLAGVLRYVPYVGPIVGTTAPIIVSFASSDGWTQTWITAGALLVLEIITNNVLEPWLYSGAAGVSTLAFLVSATFWTWIWGVPGLLLSTPLTVCLVVAAKHVRNMRFIDVLFGDAPVMSKGARLYHRLLAGDSDEAWEIVRSEAANSSVLEAADLVLVPALGLAGSARGTGRIDAESRETIRTIVHGIVDELGDSTREENGKLPSSALRALCIGAKDELDLAGSRVVAQELRRRGIDANAAAPERLLAEVAEAMRREEIDVVVISSVIPTHFLHIRSLCKRLLSVDTRTEILIGLWGEPMPDAELAPRLPSSPRLHVVTTLGAAVTWIEAAAPRLVVQRGSRAAS